MSRKLIVIILLLLCVGAVVYGLSGRTHEFLSGDCIMCHVDEKNDPMNIKPDITGACSNCHTDIKETQSHPTDLYPTMTIPKDMPLTDGMLTCITCHFVHPDEESLFRKKDYFLRRFARGPLFCDICHMLDERGHVISQKIHTGSFTETDPSVRLDKVSLECIQCHDNYINESSRNLGAGRWDHFGSKITHPIGVSYMEASMKKMRDYRGESMLRKEIRLFNGKLGCGTCHNIYSKIPKMLVMDNAGSRLCRECHMK
jgi:predicted CXXCH cytochrome family protein